MKATKALLASGLCYCVAFSFILMVDTIVPINAVFFLSFPIIVFLVVLFMSVDEELL